MDNNESLNYFMRLLTERHNNLKKTNDALFDALIGENKDTKEKNCQANLDAANNLSMSLATADRPDWLKITLQWCKWYIDNLKIDDANKYLFSNISPVRNDLLQHKWSLSKEKDDADFHFDEMYERFKKESKLPEFFDALISTLEKMIASGEIDSIKTINSIKQLLSLLRQNKSGSYFSVMASWEFMGGFIKNTLWESLDSLPVVKQLKKGFEKTVSEMDIELEELHNSIAQEMKNKYNTTVNSLTYKKQAENILEHKKDIA
ncbi:MAG: hypothetical protein WC024_11750 [Shewanella sp.]|jgi:hypothetical protein|uniref:hypothetical protein n=1 Tax=Shewanella TaxID=22 RepID=UPI0021D86F62|nr:MULTISPECIES: hypothetical protein [unclassified Shewanella]MCU8012773.1 hypothetical protein [Shewanella sp. SM74]MCU8035773.1 hypothetical protein [Shewanella sp. SM71]MCU8097651.1 hypothetical protein [Shewanella sp. SM102]